MLITIINGDENKIKILLKERITERIKNYALYKRE